MFLRHHFNSSPNHFQGIYVRGFLLKNIVKSTLEPDFKHYDLAYESNRRNTKGFDEKLS